MNVRSTALLFLSVCALSLLAPSVSAHVIPHQTKSPDFNGDGFVDFEDFLSFASAFGKVSAQHDLDSNGTVDFQDFLTFASAFGKAATPSNGGNGTGDGETDVVVSAASGQQTDGDAMAAAFAPFGRVSTRVDDDYLYVDSYGIPDHQMMVNITAWIAQVPIPQPYVDDNAWQIPRTPIYTDNNVSIEGELQRGAIALAANGIPIFNPVKPHSQLKLIGLRGLFRHSSGAPDCRYSDRFLEPA